MKFLYQVRALWLLAVMTISLLLTFSVAQAETLGEVGNEKGYSSEKNSNAFTGRVTFICLNVVKNTAANPTDIAFPLDFDIYINNKKISQVRQSWPPMIVSDANAIIYTDLNLPHGIYSVKFISSHWGLGKLFSNNEVIAQFDVLVKTDRVLNIVKRTDQESPYIAPLLKYPDTWKKNSEIDQEALSAITAIYKSNAEKLAFQESTYKENEIKALQDRDRKNAEYLVQRNLENENRAKELAQQAEVDRKLEQQKQLAAAKVITDMEKFQASIDDKTCKSYGAKFSTPAYVQCRAYLVASRQEAAERKKELADLQEKVNLLQSQLEDRDRRYSNQSANESEYRAREVAAQESELKAIQSIQKQQKAAANMDQAAKWFEFAAKLTSPGYSQPSSNIQNFNINGRMINCTYIGNVYNCR